MPNNWEVGTIETLSQDIICGKTPSTKKDSNYGNDMPFITIPDMHNCTYVINTDRSLSNEGAGTQSKKTLPKNSICVSCIGTAGLVSLVPTPSQTNQQINSIIPLMEESSYFIYLLMQTLSEKINKLGQSGSTIVNLNKTQFAKLEILIPTNAVIIEFNNIVSTMFETILSNQYEIINLTQLRDTLLPKLISGELDVSDIDL